MRRYAGSRRRRRQARQRERRRLAWRSWRRTPFGLGRNRSAVGCVYALAIAATSAAKSSFFFSMPSPTTKSTKPLTVAPCALSELLDRLLAVVLDERLAEQRDFGQELGDRALDHLLDDVRPACPIRRRARRRSSRSFATTSAGTWSRLTAIGLLAATCIARSLPSVSCAAGRGRPARRSAPPCTYDASRPVAICRANRRIDMFSPIFCTSAARARLDGLARRERPRRRARRRRPDCRARRSARPRRRTRGSPRSWRRSRSRSSLRPSPPIFASGATYSADHAFGRDAAGGLRRLGAALDAQQLLGLREVAARLPVSAFLHSIMPSPVRWRRSITMLAAISAMSSLQCVPGRDRRAARGPAPAPPPRRVPTGSAATAAGSGSLPYAVGVVRHLDEFVAGLHDLLDHVAPAFEDRVGRAAGVQADRAARIVVARDHVRDADRRMVGVDDARRSGCRASSPR